MGTDASETPRAQAHHVADSLVEVDLATELEALRAVERKVPLTSRTTPRGADLL
jgi:hypothetical protein